MPLDIGENAVTPATPPTNTDRIFFISNQMYWLDDTGTVHTVTATGGGSYAGNETPAGLVNSSNVTFTLAHTPAPAAGLMLYINGMLQYAGGVNYTLAAATITFAVASTPQTGDLLRAFYFY